ncbi:baseplate J/gp47 family protein [Desulfosporosinus sp. FKB]|uniref:baseplate assembly protein n=1 Tax=Desulfosporosinus sp. FKB TaxID=1969835 RepID=UPI001482BE8E|nr:baseplate J/gp47 family protein [Desulfosporosinus sp. FKB]
MDLSNLPDVEFASKDVDTILSDLISGYEQAYLQQTGESKTLYPGDPIRIWLYSQALREFQLRTLIDASAKQNLLKYAKGDYLDNKGAPWVTRLAATKATVPEKFILSAPQSTNQTIPAGTRVSPGNNIYFQVTSAIAVPSGTTEISTTLECTAAGSQGNGFTPGQINILVDPLPWIASVTNTDTSGGGADIEDDESLRERIWLAPESFSVAGPSGAYEFFAKQYSAAVMDVKVSSPSAGTLDIRVLLQNGEIPDNDFLAGLKSYLSDDTKRPLTDNVTVNAPEAVNYDIILTYYISTDNSTSEATIQANVNAAIESYELWQKSAIGRSINPSKLISLIMAVGAKRVDLSSPVYTAIETTQIAVVNVTSVIYGGLEDD